MLECLGKDYPYERIILYHVNTRETVWFSISQINPCLRIRKDGVKIVRY